MTPIEQAIQNLYEAGEVGHHNNHNDEYYSCPLSETGEMYLRRKYPGYEGSFNSDCNCGAHEHNERLRQALLNLVTIVGCENA